MKNSIAFLAFWAFSSAAFAQDALPGDAAQQARRYSVEIIIFSYAQGVSVGSEIFVADVPPEFDPENVQTEFGDTVPDATQPEAVSSATTRQFELVMLTEDEFQLQDAYDRLRRLQAYEPLLHFGWTQPTYPDETAEPRPLSAFVTPPPGLDGELSLYLSRYLHLAVDLQLDAPNQRNAPATPRNRDRDFNSYDDAANMNYPVRYRIKEDRIFRNGELRYFDHPKFGMLAKVSRVAEEEDSGELLGD